VKCIGNDNLHETRIHFTDTAELGLLMIMLLKAGLRCVELNEQMARTIPSAPFQAELWVENEADYPAAVALLEEWRHPANTAGSS
jgi:hypothetical protein